MSTFSFFQILLQLTNIVLFSSQKDQLLQIKSSLAFNTVDSAMNFKDLFWNSKPTVGHFVLDAAFVSPLLEAKNFSLLSFNVIKAKKCVFKLSKGKIHWIL